MILTHFFLELVLLMLVSAAYRVTVEAVDGYTSSYWSYVIGGGSDVADDFCLTFAAIAGLVTRGAMSRRWQQPIDYPSSAWIV